MQQEKPADDLSSLLTQIIADACEVATNLKSESESKIIIEREPSKSEPILEAEKTTDSVQLL